MDDQVGARAMVKGAGYPLISVLMPVYNLREYLPEAVASIQAQTLPDWEFVIVDDGSTDGSSEWLDEAAAQDARIRVVHQANAGISKALNAGLRLCRGTYVARMDGDDISLPHRFATQVAVMEADASLAIIGGGAELMSATGTVYGQVQLENDHESIRSSLLKGNAGALVHPVVMIRREILQRIGSYDEGLVTYLDLDLFLRLTDEGYARNLSQILIRYRQHSRSDNRVMNHTWVEMRRRAIMKAVDRIGAHDFVDQLLTSSHPMPMSQDPLVMARQAERYRYSYTALQLAIGVFFEKGRRVESIKYLIALLLRRVASIFD